MSVLGTLWGGFGSNAIKLTKIPRGYYLQGLALIKASKRLHSGDEDATSLSSEQLSELQIIINRVGEFLEVTITHSNPKDPKGPYLHTPKSSKEIGDSFKAAVAAIDQYQTRHRINHKWTSEELDFKHWISLVKEKDGEAVEHIAAIQDTVNKKKQWFLPFMARTIQINCWPEDDLTSFKGGEVKSRAILDSFRIEESASLDDVLLRLKMKTDKKAPLIPISRNPHFYKHFPMSLDQFRMYAEQYKKVSQNARIFPLESWTKIDDVLKQLKEANQLFLQVILDNNKYCNSTSFARNRWKIQGGDAEVVKGIFGALELDRKPYGSGSPQPDHPTNPSTTTQPIRATHPYNVYPPDQHAWHQPNATPNQRMPGAYPYNVYPPNQYLRHQPSATQNQYAPGSYQHNENSPNQHSWPQPSAIRYQHMPQPMEMPAVARLQHEAPSRSNVSTISQPSMVSDYSGGLPPAPPPTNDSSPSVNTVQTDSTPTLPVPEEPMLAEPADVKRGGTLRPHPTFDSSPSLNTTQTNSALTLPVPEEPVPAEPAEVKRGWTFRGLVTSKAQKTDREKEAEKKKAFHSLGPNQQESQVAAPSSSSTFLRPAVAQPPTRRRDRLRQMLGHG